MGWVIQRWQYFALEARSLSDLWEVGTLTLLFLEFLGGVIISSQVTMTLSDWNSVNSGYNEFWDGSCNQWRAICDLWWLTISGAPFKSTHPHDTVAPCTMQDSLGQLFCPATQRGMDIFRSLFLKSQIPVLWKHLGDFHFVYA